MNSLAYKPELLAPAGDWDALRAAVANGADAVYFGLSNFNARYRATNFGIDELPDVMHFLHDHNVRGYVALNTLIFTDELADVVKFIEQIAATGVDAVIVQDLGVAALIKKICPTLAVHGSTQMTLTEPRGIEFVKTLGVERVILARELSVDDIDQITQRTTMPVEVFVHGALCVAYSGQCLTSEALGGRSANRGQCAQACRLPYQMVVDGETRDFGDRAYLLSPQDLAAPELIAPMIEKGVVSFKIEGRLKSAHYVAATLQTYRGAINAALAHEPFVLSKQAAVDLQLGFSRGFTPGFLEGPNHQRLVPARFPKARGVRIGLVRRIDQSSILVELEAEHDLSIIKPGDGVVFDQGHPEQDEQGGRVYEVFQPTSDSNAGWLGASSEASPQKSALKERLLVSLAFGPGAINFAALVPGAIVWKTDDPAMRKRMENTFSRDTIVHREPLDFVLTGKIGEPVTLRGIDAVMNLSHEANWAGPLAVAQKHPISIEVLKEQLSRLGDSPFELRNIENNLPAECILPKSVLNELRREVAMGLILAREAMRRHAVKPELLSSELSRVVAKREVDRAASMQPRLSVMVRNDEQLNAVLEWNKANQTSSDQPVLEAVYCDFEDVRRYRAAVELANNAGCTIGLATLRVMKPSEEGLLAIISKAAPDRILVRNLGAISYYREHSPAIPLYGDYSLNVVNPLSAELLINSGLERLVPGYDMNWEQLASLVKNANPAWFEPVVHQHMPMFHMEHCVYAAMLSTGKDWRDCGRPCDRHKVELRDRTGVEFPMMVDTGCRNTVFNHVPQSAVEYLPRMLQLGLRRFRLDLLRENNQQTKELLDTYAQALAGKEPAKQMFRQLQVLNQLGVTRGTLSGV